MKITVTDDDNTENVNALIAGVRQFNVEHMEAETSQPLSVIAHDESGKLIAGVAGCTIYDNFLINVLWVDEQQRASTSARADATRRSRS
ncbi:hypothetical protein [Shewanella marinintestina]|uniref:hypothetical protein n=1 Tax=Shewanella marinintestina TaxID=190305 RepID=UPI003D161D04